ncbi:hypothetical protein OEW28_13500 [Defluviimonas sp. WL0002]|uniref:Arginine transporter n=1 Tax=Albidovulum marisflavi TaxID=2984159 RepID=A0ABT2ZEX3_9RHOB|nr:hypothetical protein [Defluviimonas sp. WL0002]MCV2869644.1 hypothetical protein [Defluviimonas sp. WL0002]
MKIARRVAAIAASGFICAGVAQAGPVETACLKSGSASASPAICTCIQYVADMTLSGSDQKMAAKFIKDPDRAQEIRTSDNAKHEAFWLRYKNFGETAETFCAQG